MKYFKWALFILLGLFIIVQFFQPSREQDPSPLPTDLFFQVTIDDSLKNVLLTSCYDCHSNQTEYPLYAYIVPFAQMINKHIQVGKQELNFSHWGTYSKQELVGHLSDICEVVEEDRMPLRSYLLLHKKARLDESQKEKMCKWSEEEGFRTFMSE